MSFREDIEEDIKDTFLAEDEFADTHQINGEEMLAVVTEISEERRSRYKDSYERGIHNRRKALQVAGSVFGRMPAVNSVLTLDGKAYLVKNASNEMGMYSIILEVTRP